MISAMTIMFTILIITSITFATMTIKLYAKNNSYVIEKNSGKRISFKDVDNIPTLDLHMKDINRKIRESESN